MKPKLKKFDFVLIVLVLLLMTPIIIHAMDMGLYPVISNSMFHWTPHYQSINEYDYYKTWESEGYNKTEVDSFPISNGFEMGDLLFTSKDDDFSIGDVVVWNPEESGVLTHRLMRKNGTKLGLIGDQNPVKFWEEDRSGDNDYSEIVNLSLRWVDEEDVQEKVVFVIPKAGIPFLFVSCIQNPFCGLGCFFNTSCLQESFNVNIFYNYLRTI
jgi:hypothetical protein